MRPAAWVERKPTHGPVSRRPGPGRPSPAASEHSPGVTASPQLQLTSGRAALQSTSTSPGRDLPHRATAPRDPPPAATEEYP